jgi:hypothetical protein
VSEGEGAFGHVGAPGGGDAELGVTGEGRKSGGFRLSEEEGYVMPILLACAGADAGTPSTASTSCAVTMTAPVTGEWGGKRANK